MKQPNSKKNRDSTAFAYERISRDDNLEGESYSISNQRKLLQKVAKEKGYTNIIHFSDDGISGVTMERPGFIQMLQEMEKGHASALFVKDLSRIGRNYIEVGKLMEEFLPEHEIRLVSVSDGVDTDEGDNDLNPIRNLFNEWYARDISKKRRISNKIKGNAGEPLSQPPYGYIKDSDDAKRWAVEEEAAAIVRRIYDMTIEGYGTEQIATMLTAEKILNPTHYWISKGYNRGGLKAGREPYHWNNSVVSKILARQEYCGDVINFKTFSKSYKNKKRMENDPENWAIFKDVHEAVIDRATWENVQQKRNNVRKRKTKNEEEKSMFSGLLKCADCGQNLWYHFNQKNPDIKYFNCSGYNTRRGNCPTTHYIRVDFLEQVVLGEIRRLTKFVSQYEDDFIKAVIGHTQQAREAQRRIKQKELYAMNARDKELDSLFERIYEDNGTGKISDDRFSRMSKRYEEEQRELTVRIRELKSDIDKETGKSMTTDMFIANIRKYTRSKKLSERMLNELIERIEVHQSEKVDGVHVQKLTIHYNGIGSIEIPDVLPQPEILMNTRKGVVVSYSQSQTSVA